jgi:hypothetical protein
MHQIICWLHQDVNARGTPADLPRIANFAGARISAPAADATAA